MEANTTARAGPTIFCDNAAPFILFGLEVNISIPEPQLIVANKASHTPLQ